MTNRVWATPTWPFIATLALLVLGLVPLPKGSWTRWARQSARSLQPNQAERKATEAGYYEGLVNLDSEKDHTGLAALVVGRTGQTESFHDINATHYLKNDLLGFELFPNLRRSAFGAPFHTNSLGFRDQEYPIQKPPDTFRAVLLGASIDMGWGVTEQQTYENRFESWLNSHAQKWDLDRSFEVLNLSMAAYSPVQRLLSYQRKGAGLRPDLVILSVTLLDPRLQQIHLSNLLQSEAEPLAVVRDYPYIASAIQRILKKIEGSPRDPLGRYTDKELLKEAVNAEVWPIIEGAIEQLVRETDQAGAKLWMVIVPRAGQSDTPQERAPLAAKYSRLGSSLDIPVIDLTAAFDDEEPDHVSLSHEDDHPNADGHKMLFKALANAVVDQPSLYAQIMGSLPSERVEEGSH